MTHKILCPTDLTSKSQDSVAYALRLAKENGAELIVVHATSFPSLGQLPCEMEAYYQWEQFVERFKMDQLLADAEQSVRKFVGTRFGAGSDSVIWKPRAALGDVADEIVRIAFQEEADLIVMARGKRGAFARFFRRSISEAVGRNAPCPVLTIDSTRAIWQRRGWRVPAFREILQNS